MNREDHRITDLLHRWREGDQASYDEAMSLAYEEIKKLARDVLSRRGQATIISPTVLVHEAYLKLAGYSPTRPWAGRREFYALLARAMMCFLVDHIRRKNTPKMGGDQIRITLEEERIGGLSSIDVLALDQVLQGLERLDTRRAEIWKCRYLCGLSIAELAELFHLANATLHRELKAANGWLRGQLVRADP